MHIQFIHDQIHTNITLMYRVFGKYCKILLLKVLGILGNALLDVYGLQIREPLYLVTAGSGSRIDVQYLYVNIMPSLV